MCVYLIVVRLVKRKGGCWARSSFYTQSRGSLEIIGGKREQYNIRRVRLSLKTFQLNLHDIKCIRSICHRPFFKYIEGRAKHKKSLNVSGLCKESNWTRLNLIEADSKRRRRRSNVWRNMEAILP